MIALLFLLSYCYPAYSQRNKPDNITLLKIQLIKRENDTARVGIYLILGKLYLDRPGREKANLDSAIYFISQGDKLSREIGYKIGYGRSMLASALVFIRKNNNENALQLIRKALICFQQAGDLLDVGETYILMGQRYDNQATNLEVKFDYFKKAAEAFVKAGAVKRAGDAYKDIGEIQLMVGKNKEALENLQTSLKFYQSVHYNEMASVYYLTSRALSRKGDFINELKFSLLAIKNIETLGDSTSPVLRNIYYTTGMAYHRISNYETAQSYLFKARRLAYMQKDTPAMTEITFNMGMSQLFNQKYDETLVLMKSMEQLKDTAAIIEFGMYTAGKLRESSDISRKNKARTLLLALQKYKAFKLGLNDQEKLASISLHTYLDLRDFKSAKVYVRQLNEIVPLKDLALTNQFDALNGIIRYHNVTGQDKAALKAIKVYQDLCRKNNLKTFNKEYELWLFKTDSVIGNYLSAIKHYQNYKRGEDSLLNESNSRQISLLNIQYETEKKDKDILLKNSNIRMLGRQSSLQRITLKQEKIKRNLTIAAALMLLIVLGVGYNRYRLKQKSNLLLQSQQLEIDNQHKKLMTSAGRLSQLLKEKEWLLREIHHRVKNNLQVTMSLLNMQSFYISNNQAQEAIGNSRRRMFAISLIHQQLYQSEGLCYINIGSYVSELGGYLNDNLGLEKKIRFSQAIANMEIDVAQAVPLGLLINEAITNCFRHAFVIRNDGTISVRGGYDDKGYIELSISDNGSGLPQGFSKIKGNTLGMNLMYGLSNQLDGDLTITGDDGTFVKIIFKPINSLEEDLSDISSPQNIYC